MYDEMTRQQDNYWASLAYAQEEGMRMGIEQGHAVGRTEGMKLGIEQGHAAGRAEGIEQGRAAGREEGRLNTINTIADLVKGGFLTKELGAKKLNLSIQEFETYL